MMKATLLLPWPDDDVLVCASMRVSESWVQIYDHRGTSLKRTASFVVTPLRQGGLMSLADH